MYEQTFSWSDAPIVGVLVLLEGLLSADNALVLAIMVRHLSPKQQKQALSLGLGMSFGFRFVVILLATQVMRLWWLQALGGLYLLYLPLKHFLKKPHDDAKARSKQMSYGATIFALGVTDIAFALDSVLAAVATVRGHDKVWVVVLGALLGVIMLRFSAHAFIKLLEKFPALDHVAYCLVGWAGVKLCFESGHTFDRSNPGVLAFHWPELSPVIFWGVMATIAIGGTLLALRSGNKANSSDN